MGQCTTDLTTSYHRPHTSPKNKKPHKSLRRALPTFKKHIKFSVKLLNILMSFQQHHVCHCVFFLTINSHCFLEIPPCSLHITLQPIVYTKVVIRFRIVFY